MKKYIISIVLFAMITSVTIGCGKESSFQEKQIPIADEKNESEEEQDDVSVVQSIETLQEVEDHYQSEEVMGSENSSADMDEEDAYEYLREEIEMGNLPEFEGMSILFSDEQEEIYGEECWYFQVGTNHEEQFVTEYHVYVSKSGAIYEYDVIEDAYKGLNTEGKLYEYGWSTDSLAAVITDPYSEEAMHFYAAQPLENHMVIVCMQDNMSIRLEKIHIDFDSYQSVVDEVLIEKNNVMRGYAEYLEIPMAETLPEYRIVVKWQDKHAEWNAIYDGENGDKIQYLYSKEGG